jgi:hypothetical protein
MMMAWNRVAVVEWVKMLIFYICVEGKTNTIYYSIGFGE